MCDRLEDDEDEKDANETGWSAKGKRRGVPSIIRVWYESWPVHYLWVALVLLGFGLQASKTARSSPEYLAKLGRFWTGFHDIPMLEVNAFWLKSRQSRVRFDDRIRCGHPLAFIWVLPSLARIFPQEEQQS